MEFQDIIMELQELHCMPQINTYNYQDSLDDFLTAAQNEDYDLIMRISGLQDAHPAAAISSSCIDTRINLTNLNQSTCNQPDNNSAEVRFEEANYAEQAAPQSSMKFLQYVSPFDHSDANVENPDNFTAARRTDGAVAGRLVFLNSACANDLNHNYQQAARAGREKHLQNYADDHKYDDRGAAAAGRLEGSGNDHNQNDQIHQLNYTAGLRSGETNYIETAARPPQREEDHNDDADDQRAGISSEEEGISGSSSSSMEKQKKKEKRKSGTIYFSSCKPLDNERDSRLKLHRGSPSLITKKRAAPFIPPPQYRRPIIIHTYSPKIIHTSRSKFMWLVQSLTGSAETRSRCLENPPLHDHPLHQTNSAASMEAQDPLPASSAHHIAPTYHHDEPAPMQAANPMMQTAPYHHDKYHASSTDSPLNSCAITPNYTFKHINNVINTHCKSSNHNISHSCTSTRSSPLMLGSPNVFSQELSNLSLNHINGNELCSNTEQSSSSTSCSSTLREVSPRGPFCARECNDGAHAKPSFIAGGGAHAIITPPAPNFESWPLIHDQLVHNNMEGSVHSNNSNLQQAIHNYLIFNPNYVSNHKPSVNFQP